jgi:hypothetical protein
MRKDFFKPSVSKTILCATCSEIVLFEREKCGLCGIAIDHQALATEAEIRVINTQAVSVANTITSFNIGLFGYVFAAVGYYYYGVFSELREVAVAYGIIIGVIGMIPPYLTFRWLSIYGSLQDLDQESRYKKIKLTVFLYVWGIAHIINFCLAVNHLFYLYD